MTVARVGIGHRPRRLGVLVPCRRWRARNPRRQERRRSRPCCRSQSEFTIHASSVQPYECLHSRPEHERTGAWRISRRAARSSSWIPRFEPRGERRERLGRTFPLQRIDRVEERDVSAERGEAPEQERPLALGRERGPERRRIRHVGMPVVPVVGDRVDRVRTERAPRPPTSVPIPGARESRRRCRPRAPGSRESTPGGRRSFATTPASSRSVPRRRSSRRLGPATHWARSLSGEQMTTCSTRELPRSRKRGGGQRVVRFELDHRPDHHAERAHGALREQWN